MGVFHGRMGLCLKIAGKYSNDVPFQNDFLYDDVPSGKLTYLWKITIVYWKINYK